MTVLISAWPCHWCQGQVELVSGACQNCGKVHREPQPGPQTDFILSEAELRIFAGAMGTGKTFALLLDWYIKGAAVPGANGLICRKHQADIDIGGGLWDKAREVFGADLRPSAVRMREGAKMDAVWPATMAKLSFRHLREDSVQRKKGPEFSWIGIEEADECDMDTILWLLQRMRSVHGIRPTMALSTNPNPFHPLRQWVDWYVYRDDEGRLLRGSDGRERAPLDPRKSGVIRWTMAHATTGRRVFGATPEEVAEQAEGDPSGAMSYAVFSSILADNPILEARDGRYRSKFAQMPPAERAKNLDADWDAAPDLEGMLAWHKWGLVDKPIGSLIRHVRGWDMAYTRARPGNNPDFTASMRWAWDDRGNAYLCGASACREDPPEALTHMRAVATLDGPAVTQACFEDPAAGRMAAQTMRENFRRSPRCGPVAFAPAGNRQGQKIANAMALSEAIKQGRVYVLVGDWLDEPYRDGGNAPRTIGELIRSQLDSFPDPEDKAKDDLVDAASRAFNVGDRGPKVATDRPVQETVRAAAERIRSKLGRR